MAYVLVMAAVVAIIATGILRMVLMSYNLNSRTQASNQGRKSDEAALAKVTSAWTQSGANQYCVNNVPGYGCSGNVPGSCACTCNCVGGGCPAPTIIGSGAWPNCRLDISSPP